jgi:hypothetical protein
VRNPPYGRPSWQRVYRKAPLKKNELLGTQEAEGQRGSAASVAGTFIIKLGDLMARLDQRHL